MRHKLASKGVGALATAPPFDNAYDASKLPVDMLTTVKSQGIRRSLRVSGFPLGASSALCSWPRKPWPLACGLWRPLLRPEALNRHQAEGLPSVRRHAKSHLHLGRFQQFVIEGLLQLLNEIFARFHGLQQLPDLIVRDRPSALLAVDEIPPGVMGNRFEPAAETASRGCRRNRGACGQASARSLGLRPPRRRPATSTVGTSGKCDGRSARRTRPKRLHSTGRAEAARAKSGMSSGARHPPLILTRHQRREFLQDRVSARMLATQALKQQAHSARYALRPLRRNLFGARR